MSRPGGLRSLGGMGGTQVYEMVIDGRRHRVETSVGDGWSNTATWWVDDEELATATSAAADNLYLVADEEHELADEVGSTERIIKVVSQAPAGTKWVVGTELNLVQRLGQMFPEQQISFLEKNVCYCSTMNRIDLPHLVWALESLVEGRVVADAFCHSMVRSVVGALVAVGTGRRDAAWLAGLVDAVGAGVARGVDGEGQGAGAARGQPLLVPPGAAARQVDRQDVGSPRQQRLERPHLRAGADEQGAVARQRDRFLAAFAHELRTPLAILDLHAQNADRKASCRERV